MSFEELVAARPGLSAGARISITVDDVPAPFHELHLAGLPVVGVEGAALPWEAHDLVLAAAPTGEHRYEPARARAEGLSYVVAHLDTEPECATAWADGAALALALGRNADADAFAQRALAADPADPTARSVLTKLGRPTPEPNARDRLESWVRSHAERLVSPVLDVGTSRSQRAWIDTRALRLTLDGCSQVFDATQEAPDIVADLADLSALPDHAFGSVLCTEVLEHVRYPDRALAELRRVTRPGGTLLLSVPWFYPFHPCPLDLRRFTLQGLETELRDAGWTVEVKGGLPMPAAAKAHLAAALELMTGRRGQNVDSLGYSNWVIVATA